MDLVASSWAVPVSGSPFFFWEEKLRRLKKDLKLWAKSLPSLSAARMEAQVNLENHQLSLEEHPLDLANMEKEATLHHSLHAVCRLEEENLIQKFRCLWLKAGDQNSGFFHKEVEGRKNFNSVKEEQIQGQTTKDFEEIKRAAHDHFQRVYSAEGPFMGSPILDDVPSLIRHSKNHKLSAPISNK